MCEFGTTGLDPDKVYVSGCAKYKKTLKVNVKAFHIGKVLVPAMIHVLCLFGENQLIHSRVIERHKWTDG